MEDPVAANTSSEKKRLSGINTRVTMIVPVGQRNAAYPSTATIASASIGPAKARLLSVNVISAARPTKSKRPISFNARMGRDGPGSYR
jgi:hypothetical protein